MPRYIITERAGRFVAGHTNTGVGTALDLTERAAAHEVRLGTLVPAPGISQTQALPELPATPRTDVPSSTPDPDDDHDDRADDPATRKRRRSKPSAE